MSEPNKLPTVPSVHDMVMRCHGECHSRGECAGDVKAYEIIASPHGTAWNGLRFNYCEVALLHDLGNGFFLNIVQDVDSGEY